MPLVVNNVLPFYLSPNRVAIYGDGVVSSPINGLQGGDLNQKFGYVYGVFDGGNTFLLKGTSVMFNKNDIECKILVAKNYFYNIIDQARLVCSEVEPIIT